MEILIFVVVWGVMGTLTAWYDAPYAIDRNYDPKRTYDKGVSTEEYGGAMFFDVCLWPLMLPYRIGQNRGYRHLAKVKELELENRAKAVRVHELEQEIAALAEEQDR